MRARATGAATIFPVPDVKGTMRSIPAHIRVLGAELERIGGVNGLAVYFSYGPVKGCKPSDVRRALRAAAPNAEIEIAVWDRREVPDAGGQPA